MLGWLTKHTASAIVRELVTGQRALTHAGLDELPDAKPLRHLRSVLAVSRAAAAGEGLRAGELFAPLVPLMVAVRGAGAAPTGLRAATALRFGVGTATRRPLAPCADDSGIRAVLDAAGEI
mgnify:CR=1 FL=1